MPLLRNARIAGDPVDIRIEGGVITEIGVLQGVGDDLGGRWVSPGLWDNHTHFSQLSLRQRRLDLSFARSAAEAASLVAASFAGQPLAGEPLVGYGFRDAMWPDLPTAALLDAASGSTPVALLSADLHAAWLNSAALAESDRAGHPTGLLQEDDAFDLVKRLNTVSDSVLDGWAIETAGVAASRGVVGIVDLEMAWNLEVWQRRVAVGHDRLRVEFGVYTEHLERAIAEGLQTGQSCGDLLTVGRFKVLSDGSLNTRTAYCFDDYPGLGGSSHPRGVLTIEPDRLLALMRKAADNGLEPDVHAIGDRANAVALDAFAELGRGGRIEHAQLVAASDLPRFAELGVVASVQPEHAMDDRDIADFHWAGRSGRSFAFRSLLDAGAKLVFGSDAPVSPLDPWITMAAAVGRSRDSREPWHPEQRVSNVEALAASTHSTVEVGQPADLVVTDLDPLTATHEQLRSMPVAATLLGGRFTWDAR